MARITLSPFVTDIRGKLKGGVIFSSNQHSKIMYLQNVIPTSATVSQDAQRTAFQDAITAWNNLSETAKAQYHADAKAQGLPNGVNVFVSSELGGGSGGGAVEETTLTITVPFDGSQQGNRLPIGGSFGYYNFRYTFDVLAEGQVVIETSGGMEPILWLDDDSGNEVASDNGSLPGYESIIDTTLTTGTYTLQVGSYGFFGDGTVDITGYVANVTQTEP